VNKIGQRWAETRRNEAAILVLIELRRFRTEMTGAVVHLSIILQSTLEEDFGCMPN